MLSDLRFAFRQLIKSPGFTLLAIAALGFGIGLSTAIFNAFSAVLLRPLPNFRDESRLVFLNSEQLSRPGNYYSLSEPDFVDIRANAKLLTGVTTASNKTVILAGRDAPERIMGSDVSVEGFTMFGVQPVRGRLFTPKDGEAGAPPVALIGYGLWQRRFGGRDDVIGHVETMNGRPTTIVGVLPAGFAFPETQELWMPMFYKNDPNTRASHSLGGWARLKDGVSLDEARAELATLAARLALEHKETNEGKGLAMRPVREEATEDTALLMNLMLGSALFVLLIACANVANLLLARAAGRSHEIAIRVSVGATRGRIVRQILTESLLLGVLGGGFGLLVGVWANGLLVGALPTADIPFWMSFDFDWRVFCFAAGAALASSLIFGLLPALQASRSTALEMKEGSRSITSSRRSRVARQGLVIAQVALSAILLISAGLFVRSFLKLQSTPLGYDPAQVITFRVGMPPSQYDSRKPEVRDQIRQFFAQLTPRLAELPGVTASGATYILPCTGNNTNAFLLEGDPFPRNVSESHSTAGRGVNASYFSAFRIPVLRGRTFDATDKRDSPRVAVVDQQFVDKWCNGASPIGRRVRYGYSPKDEVQWMEIIGVVGNVPTRVDRPYEDGAIYSLVDQEDYNFISYVLRVTGDPTTYGPAIQRAVLSVNSNIPIYNLLPQERLDHLAYWKRGFFGQVFSAFGLGALFLAALGVYGVMAYSVSQRTPEFGVRMALGASPRDILRLVSRQGIGLVAVGLVVGVLSALALTRLMASVLFGISPSDPPTYFALTTVLAAVGLLACWIPARRATRVDPLVALRSE